ncbi:exo-alpha-sialidase [Stieleria mannarensis]|uniref:exo-alpha-sialidase n=1 Tax=Stieleria mannarensis TaxID=2755585 RepID=UPI002570E74E|nr:exo-alpha-sialidase [Rhodopirellula sp. JC639]
MKLAACFLPLMICGVLLAAEPRSKPTPENDDVAGLMADRSVIVTGDSDWDWTQARTAMVPQQVRPFFLTTMSRTAKVGAHGYHDVFVVFADQRADTWNEPRSIASLKRLRREDGYEVVAGDLCPIWHAKSEKVLVTGKTFNFAEGSKEDILREQVSYCVFDPATRTFGPLRILEMPAKDHGGHPIIAPNAGCHQQVVLDDGTVLLPVRYQRSSEKRNYTSIVAKCSFDGTTLRYIEHGTEHSLPNRRGLYEPSVTQHDGAFFLTLRADDGAWVARSSEGIHFSNQIPWKFDDGEALGSYNTQQHWITLGGRLYLVYTRRGADNDHIMRHRAPLFVAEVDPKRLVVLKDTEQIVVPENHATLGNSGVCRINDNESWITVAEGRVSHGKRKGENNQVILVKLTADGNRSK